MVIAFIYGAVVGAVVGVTGWTAWRLLPGPFAGLAGIAGAAAVIAAIAAAPHAGVSLAGAGNAVALVLGLVAGGTLVDAVRSHRGADGRWSR
ncbi:hypothetical protein [Oryzihumus sp.]